jgi:hypothetical protein
VRCRPHHPPRVIQECYKRVTWVLHGCYKGVTKSDIKVTNMLQTCYIKYCKNITKTLEVRTGFSVRVRSQMLQICYTNVARVLQGCYKYLQDRFLCACEVPNIDATVTTCVTSVLRGCYKSVTRVLQRCYKCYKSVTRVCEIPDVVAMVTTQTHRKAVG